MTVYELINLLLELPKSYEVALMPGKADEHYRDVVAVSIGKVEEERRVVLITKTA